MKRRKVLILLAVGCLAACGVIAVPILDRTVLAKRAVTEAVEAFNKRDWKRADERYTAAIRKLPESGDYEQRAFLASVYSRRAIVRVKLKEYDEALEDLSKSIQIAPESSYSYFLRGETKLKLGQFGDAEADLEETLRRNKNNSTAAYYIGLISEHQGNLAKAIEHYHKSIDVTSTPEAASSSDAKFYAALSRVLKKTGDSSGAEKAGQTALRLYPSVSFDFPDLAALPRH